MENVAGEQPFIRLTRLKFELTNQNSREKALNIHEKGLQFSKSYQIVKSQKYSISNLAPNMDRRRPAWQLARSSSSVAR